MRLTSHSPYKQAHSNLEHTEDHDAFVRSGEFKQYIFNASLQIIQKKFFKIYEFIFQNF